MAQCKEIQENWSPDFFLLKRPFEAHGKGKRWNSRITIFFATFSSPTGREYTRWRPLSKQTVLEIRRRKKSCWKKRERRDVSPKWDTLISCTTSGLPLRNKPLCPFLKGNFHERRLLTKHRKSNAVFREVNQPVCKFLLQWNERKERKNNIESIRKKLFDKNLPEIISLFLYSILL